MLSPLLPLLMVLGSSVVYAASDDKPYGGRLQVETVKDQSVTDDGKTIQYPLTEHPQVKTLRIQIPSGKETGWHYHSFPGYGYVLAGTMEVILENGRKNRYETGEAIYEIVKIPHNGRCISTIPCDLIVTFTSAEDVPVTVMVPPMEESSAQ
ncbi:hypothetical protein GCM10023116_01050 [Kistimonas scapharcae]|uniref:Cupin type-2 domain-containing protein n=1 Tax=Kistimonas scapharcae TaxID=1036133 RepID=A0ABP8UXC5_9GAMM